MYTPLSMPAATRQRASPAEAAYTRGPPYAGTAHRNKNEKIEGGFS